MNETYTFELFYNSNGKEKLEMSVGNEEVVSLDEECDFRKGAVKILRTLCVLSQTLANLPSEKFVTMKIYFNEWTPASYQPPGFKGCDDSNYCFQTKPLKIDLGSATSSTFGLNVKMQTSCDEAAKEEKSSIPSSFAYSYDIKTLSQATDLNEVAPSNSVNCLCGVNLNDLDMIWCDECLSWQHTVCVGFFSNKDKRIPKDLPFICPRCSLKSNGEPISDSQPQLALLRRTLSIVFNENFESIGWLSRRIGITRGRTLSIWKTLEKEGFARSFKKTPSDPFLHREIIKSEENRNKIKKLFVQDVSNYSKKRTPLAIEKGDTVKRVKVSQPVEDIHCI